MSEACKSIIHLIDVYFSIWCNNLKCSFLQIRIKMLQDVAVQVDGEPWVQPAGIVTVLKSALKVTIHTHVIQYCMKYAVLFNMMSLTIRNVECFMLYVLL